MSKSKHSSHHTSSEKLMNRDDLPKKNYINELRAGENASKQMPDIPSFLQDEELEKELKEAHDLQFMEKVQDLRKKTLNTFLSRTHIHTE